MKTVNINKELYNMTSTAYDIKTMDCAGQRNAKELIKEPYKVLIELLINGPKSEKLVKLIPDGTKLNKIEIKNDCIYIDFSNEFINGQKLGKEQEELIIKSIVNTVTELKEINSVKILIDGKENQEFPDKEINFKEPFKR